MLNAAKSRKFSFIAHSIFRRLLLLKLAPTSSLLLRVTFGQCCSNPFQKALAAHSFFFREGFKSSLRISTCNEKQEVLFRCTTYFRTGSLSRTTSNLWVFVALRNLSEFILFLEKGSRGFSSGKTAKCNERGEFTFVAHRTSGATLTSKPRTSLNILILVANSTPSESLLLRELSSNPQLYLLSKVIRHTFTLSLQCHV